MPARALDPLVPEPVRAAIARDITKAVEIAVSRFDYGAAKEDGLSQALIERLVDEVDGRLGAWLWSVRPLLISSNLPDGGEGVLGADFVLQADVYQRGINTAHKILPVQAKKLWSARDALLGGEARKLAAFPGSGLVVDFDPEGYLAVRAEVAAKADGDRRRIKPSAFRPLDEMLGDDFLLCRVGTQEGYINARGTEVVMSDGQRIRIRTDKVARLTVKSTTPPSRATPPRKRHEP